MVQPHQHRINIFVSSAVLPPRGPGESGIGGREWDRRVWGADWDV